MPTSCTVRSLLCTVCTLYNYLVNIDADVSMMPCANVDNVVSAPMNQDKCSVDRILGPYVESSAPQKDEYRMDSNLEKKDQGNKEIKMLHTTPNSGVVRRGCCQRRCSQYPTFCVMLLFVCISTK